MSDRKTNSIRLLALVPAVLTAGLISGFVIFNTFAEGLGYIPELSMYRLDFSALRDLFADDVFLKGLALSCRVALISTLLCSVFGVLLAYAVIRTGNRLLSFSTALPLILSYVVAGILVYNLFSDHGIIYHLLVLAGVKTEGIKVLFTESAAGVVILYCFKGTPFVAISVMPVLSRVMDRYTVAAANLGASKPRIYARIVFPLIRHSVAAAALVLFNYEMFTYESYFYLGSSTPVALGVYAYKSSRLSDLRSRAAGMTVNAVMILISLVTVVLYAIAVGREAKTDEG